MVGYRFCNLRKEDHVCMINFVEPLNLEKSYEIETLGVQAMDCPCPNVSVLCEEKRAMELIKKLPASIKVTSA